MPIARSYSDIVSDAKTRIQKNTPVNNFNPQGTVKALVDVMALEIENYYNDLEYLYNAIDPTLAVGNDLDKIGFLVGVRRDNASTASDYTNTNFYFYLDPLLNMSLSSLINRYYSFTEQQTLIQNGFLQLDANGQSSILTIPAGHTVQSSDGGIAYTTISVTSLSNGNSYVGVVATGVGSSYNVESNSLIAHTLASIPELRKISAYIKCTNTFPIQNGGDTMTDDQLRYAISIARAAISTNELAIRSTVLSLPGIRDCLFEKNKYGNGTISVIIDGVSPLISQGLIDTAEELVKQKLSFGDTIYITRPNYLGVEIIFGIRVSPIEDNTSGLQQQAISAVIQYINNLPIGGQIVWNAVVDQVMNITGIEDFIPVSFKYGTYDSVNKINQNQIALQFRNQQAKYNQKFYTDSGLVVGCAQ